jgi:putative ABC transport system permease protein
MFYAKYLVRELYRRRIRSLVTVACIAMATGLVISTTAVSRGVDNSQTRVLTPLKAIGADLVVTRNVTADATTSSQDMWNQNADAVKTDLSQLGDPGTRFSRDFFLPGVELTMPAADAGSIAQLAGAQAYSVALSMVATHQEGTVPKIVASFETGGQTINVDQPIAPLTVAEINQVNACIAALPRQQVSGPPGSAPGKTAPGPPTPEQMQSCLPDRFKHFRATIVTPRETVTQVLNPPQTDIKTASFTVMGVDTSHLPGPLSPGQVTNGRFFAASADRAAGEAIAGQAYAQRHQLSLGSQITLNGTSFTVVGIARPVIGLQAADIYLSLPELQRLAKQEGNVNVVLIRLTDGASVDAAVQRIQRSAPDLQVTSNRDLAKKISASLSTSVSITDQGTRILNLIVLIVTVVFVSLMSWGGIHSRTRELGTLRAIGWSRWLLIRQILGESLILSVAGAIAGLGLGFGAASAIGAWLPPLTASFTADPSAANGFGLGDLMPVIGQTATERISPSPDMLLVVMAMVLAIGAGMLAGSAGSILAARLQPSQAVQRLT